LSEANIRLVREGPHKGTPAEPETVAEANSAAMARGEKNREGRDRRKITTRNTGYGPWS
jgi:hypothetical protein